MSAESAAAISPTEEKTDTATAPPPYDPNNDPNVAVIPPDFSTAKPGYDETDSAVSAVIAAAEATLMSVPSDSVVATDEYIKSAMQQFEFVEAPVPTLEFAVTALKCLGADRCAVFAKPPSVAVWFGSKPGKMLARVEPAFSAEQLMKLGEGAVEKMKAATAAAHSVLLSAPKPPPPPSSEKDEKKKENEEKTDEIKLALEHDTWKYDYVSKFLVLDGEAHPVALEADAMSVTTACRAEEKEPKEQKKENKDESSTANRAIASSAVSIKTLVNQQRIVAKALTELRKFSGEKRLRVAIGDVRIVIDIAIVNVEDGAPKQKAEEAAAAAEPEQKPTVPTRHSAITMNYNLEYSRELTCETY